MVRLFGRKAKSYPVHILTTIDSQGNVLVGMLETPLVSMKEARVS